MGSRAERLLRREKDGIKMPTQDAAAVV